jgi:hypothetical protein
MGLGRFMGFFVVIPASVLLAISYFVLLTIRKAETGALRAFGYVVASVLWTAVAFFFVVGIYILGTGKYPFNRTMHTMSKVHGMAWCMKMHNQMQCDPAMMQAKEAMMGCREQGPAPISAEKSGKR